MKFNSGPTKVCLAICAAWCMSFLLQQPSALANEAGDGAAASVQIHTFKTHSRLVFRLDEGVQAQWKDAKNGFELLFKGIGISELGAPFGAEQEWLRKYETIKDSRLAGLEFKEVAEGLLVIGKWKFLGGDLAPAHPEMEHFDYRQKTPVTYVLDFWPKPGPTVAELRSAQLKAKRLAALKLSEENAKKRRDRRIAHEKSRAEVEDVTKFCRQPLSEEKDIFLAFNPLHEKFSWSTYFPTTTADSEYMYLEPKTNSKDAQYARLALSLYRQGQPALTIRTLDFFDAEHPNSFFRHEMRFLRANAMIKLGLVDEAVRILNELVATEGESGVALHAGMFTAVRSLVQGNNLAALEGFLWLVAHHPEHRLAWAFHLGAAEALYALKQTDRAAKEYQWVMMNAAEKKQRAEAASRFGDLYLSRFQYERALGAYSQALNYFKDEATKFPSLFINRAETLYWLGQYDRAEAEFKNFITEYPSHPVGWKALYRLGEIYGRKAGEANVKESRKWFYETVNRFPFSPGAVLAREMLLPCGDHAAFDLKSAEKFFAADAVKFDGAGEVVMDRYADFKGISRVRSLVSLGGNEQTVSAAVEELKSNMRPDTRKAIESVLMTVFRKAILSLLADGKKYEALAFYQEKVAALSGQRQLQENHGLEYDYLLRLSQAASDLGLGKKAEELVTTYGKMQAAGRSIATVDPSDLDARLKLSEERYARARALWTSQGMGAESQIRDLLNSVIPESEFSYEKEILLGLMDEKAGKTASALSHAVRAQLSMPALPSGAIEALTGDRARLEYWIATLNAEAGNTRAALESYQKLRKQKRAEASVAVSSAPASEQRGVKLGLPPVPAIEKLMMAEGEILVQQNKWGEAATLYASAVEEGVGGNRALYGYARALSKSKDDRQRAQAKTVYAKLAESKVDDFWKKLALEVLAVSKSEAKEGRK